MMEPPLTRFGVLRHAETRWNASHRIQGLQDSPLTAAGVSQALRWGRHLEDFRWDRMVASSAGRARRTAELMNIRLQIPLVYDTRLREQDWGRWTGQRVTRIRQTEPRSLAAQESAGWLFCPPGGEERNRVWERSLCGLARAHDRWPGQRILVVTHEAVIKCLIYRICGRRFLPEEPRLLMARGLHCLAYDGRKLAIEKINVTLAGVPGLAGLGYETALPGKSHQS
jgi:probable phosphoglycerate mutase